MKGKTEKERKILKRKENFKRKGKIFRAKKGKTHSK